VSVEWESWRVGELEIRRLGEEICDMRVGSIEWESGRAGELESRKHSE